MSKFKTINIDIQIYDHLIYCGNLQDKNAPECQFIDDDGCCVLFKKSLKWSEECGYIKCHECSALL